MDSIRLFKLDNLNINDSNFTNTEKELINWRISFLKNFDVTIDEFNIDFSSNEKYNHSELSKFLFNLNLGDYYFYKYENDVLVAQKAYLKALEIGMKSTDEYMICEALKKILEINKHSFLNDNNTSKYYLEIYKKYKYDKYEEGFYSYYRLLMSFQYYKKDAWNTEEEIYLKQYADKLEIPFLSGKIYHLLSTYYASEKNLDKAIKFKRKAIKIFEGINFNYKKTQQINSRIGLLRYYVLANKFEKAGKLLDSIEYIKPNGLDKGNQRYLLFYAAIIDSANANYKQGFNNLMNYNFQSENFILKNNKRIYDDLEIKYQASEKEKQILKEQQKARTNRNWLITASLALFFGAGIAFLLQKNTTKKRKLAEQQQLLEQQKVTTLLKEQELTSIDAMIEGQEKERTKVANELHDDLGSLMATVKLHFDNVKVDQKDPALKNAQKLLDEAYQKIRGMAHAKNSGVMANQGLLPAVKKMAKTISETNALEVTVEDFGLGERMENSLELTIFRIIQELIANIIKHAEATKSNIQFTQHESNLNIIVEDNGKGFDMAAIKRTQNGMGLGTIEKRIEHLEGTFTVDSVLGKGTSILIDIPV